MLKRNASKTRDIPAHNDGLGASISSMLNDVFGKYQIQACIVNYNSDSDSDNSYNPASNYP